MKRSLVFAAFIMLFSSLLSAQVGINSDNTLPASSAMLDVKSTQAGLLLPRMTHDQISLIVNPANGLQVFCTTDAKLYLFTGTEWNEVAYGAGPITPYTCGSNFVKNHVTGVVAPVTKTVTYCTVYYGSPFKCWISSNLGADHQATAVNDASEASAGWLWQFNRMQGFKHDGSNRTPNTAWINPISENSDWIAANDPCAIEFGNSWRIPTYSEWNNLDLGGNWTSWDSPWNSPLKLHAAGYLFYVNGALYSRGACGDYWASTQANSLQGFELYFYNIGSYVDQVEKAHGLSVRCLRDF